MADVTVYRLAEPKKKGLLPLLFSRFILIALLIVLQALLFFVLLYRMAEFFPWFSAAEFLFTVLMVIYLFNSGMDSAAKLTWMFLVAILPLPGAAMLLFTRTDVGHRRTRKRVAALTDMTRDAIPQPAGVPEDLKAEHPDAASLHVFMNRTGCFPVYRNTHVTYFRSGEEQFRAVLTELERAEKFIFLESFIIEEGYMWGETLRVLERKAASGVEVRVMYDGMCESNKLPSDYCGRLGRLGIRAKAFSPIRPILSSQYNYRDHRKVLVIDGRTAFNGGMNFADEYVNRTHPFGYWKDAGVMLRGEAVRSFTLMFLQMWNLDEPEPAFAQWLEAPYDPDRALPEERGTGFVIPFADCPLDGDKVGEGVYMHILNTAKRYVHIMTPYLILDGEMETALRLAAKRGVDVRVILPGRPDKKLAWALAKSHYSRLTEAGVRLYEFAPGFLHSKVFVSDDTVAVVGTINLDYRSLYHHFECATYMAGTDCIPQIEVDFRGAQLRSREVTPESIRNEKIFYKLTGSLMKFVAPLM